LFSLRRAMHEEVCLCTIYKVKEILLDTWLDCELGSLERDAD
jgi:hypothetical protein